MNLQEGMIAELNRARELEKIYQGLPLQSGFFGLAVIRTAIQRGEKALGSGDVVEMASSYAELKELE